MRKHYIPILSPFANGDVGVDIFFVLSGFLICHILLKECSKNDGDLDGLGFIRNRFFRIWPALFYWNTCNLPIIMVFFGITGAFTGSYLNNLTFLNNYFGHFSHLWSVAVEF